MKNRRFESNLSKITRPVAAIKSLRSALFQNTRCSILPPCSILPRLTISLGSCENSLEKYITHWSILFICNIFSCWLVLLFYMQIVLALVCNRNPSSVLCFGTIFPNQNVVFASFSVTRPVLCIEKLSHCQTLWWVPLGWIQWGATWPNNSILTLNMRNNMISLHQRSARTSECKISRFCPHVTQVTLSWTVSSCPAGISCSWRPLPYWITRHNHLMSRQCRRLVSRWRVRRIRPQKTSPSQSENSAP